MAYELLLGKLEKLAERVGAATFEPFGTKRVFEKRWPTVCKASFYIRLNPSYYHDHIIRGDGLLQVDVAYPVNADQLPELEADVRKMIALSDELISLLDKWGPR